MAWAMTPTLSWFLVGVVLVIVVGVAASIILAGRRRIH